MMSPWCDDLHLTDELLNCQGLRKNEALQASQASLCTAQNTMAEVSNLTTPEGPQAC